MTRRTRTLAKGVLLAMALLLLVVSYGPLRANWDVLVLRAVTKTKKREELASFAAGVGDPERVADLLVAGIARPTGTDGGDKMSFTRALLALERDRGIRLRDQDLRRAVATLPADDHRAREFVHWVLFEFYGDPAALGHYLDERELDGATRRDVELATTMHTVGVISSDNDPSVASLRPAMLERCRAIQFDQKTRQWSRPERPR